MIFGVLLFMFNPSPDNIQLWASFYLIFGKFPKMFKISQKNHVFITSFGVFLRAK